MLAQLLRELETAAHGDLQPYEALHQVRILGKQLRYAMEIFESCFAPDFRRATIPPSSRCRTSSAWPTTAMSRASA